MKKLLGGLGALVLMGGCVGLEGAVVPAEPPGPRWVPSERAEASGLPAWSLTMPLGERRDGSELMREFLEAAEAAGAGYLAGVDLVLGVEREGQPVECRTRLSPVLAARASAPPEDPPETRPWRVAETRTVAEWVTHCQMVSYTTSRPETRTDWVHDPHSGGSRSVTSTHMVSHTAWRQECHPMQEMRTVTRFAYQFHAGFTPPDLEWLAAEASTPKLQESAPVCLPVASGARPGPSHRIEARLHGCTDATLPPPVDKPEGEMSRAERLRAEYRRKALEARGGPRCVDQVVQPEFVSLRGEREEPPAAASCPDSAPPEVDKPEGEMTRAERLRQDYRRKALAAGKRDCGVSVH